MTTTTTSVTEKIEQIAQMAGLRGQKTGELMVFGFDLGNGRRQSVFVGSFAEGSDGSTVICFMSACQKFSGGLLGGVKKNQAVQMLRINSQLPFGHFCLCNIAGSEYLCVRTTQLLETMEVREFETHCVAVAQLADAWEQKLGNDNF